MNCYEKRKKHYDAQNAAVSLRVHFKVYLVDMDPEESSKHCIAVGISRRLAGYWEKFSISNHHVSVELHRLW